jgi:hypothetical protein
MNPWNQLLAAIDGALGFPNRLNSSVKKLKQGYDNNTNEHVIWLEYRVRVNPGDHFVRQPENRSDTLLDALTR